MPLVARLIFEVVKWRARRSLAEREYFADEKKEAKRRGVQGETFAYWYLRGQGYVFVARNFIPRGGDGEIDLVGYDRDTLVFVEVRTRTVQEGMTALPELSVTREKQDAVARTAKRFLLERHVKDCPLRFDVVAIDATEGEAPAVRLHKAAFSPQL